MFPIETIILRPRPWPAFLVMAVGILLFFISHKNNESLPIYFAFAFIAFAIVMWFLFSKASITIDDSGFIYKTVFVTQEILWDSVIKTYIKYRHHGKSGSYYWYFENSNGNKAKFSIKLYSRASLKAIAGAVTMKCKNADIEQRILNIAEGQFPWYIW